VPDPTTLPGPTTAAGPATLPDAGHGAETGTVAAPAAPSPLDELHRRLPGRVSERAADLESHSGDETGRVARPPAAVVWATSTEDVREVLSWSAETRVPVIPYGAGTSAEEQIVPLGGEIALDLSGMNRVLAVRPADFLAVAQPGVTRTALNRAVAAAGLFFPVDPGADASLGGMAATNASGTTTVRYGGMRANVLAVEAVLPGGRTVRCGRGVRKTSSGYDLKDLLIGSAGTLAVLTELTVTLHPQPAHAHAQRIVFGSVEAAVAAATEVMGAALPVARLELVDALSLRAVNRHLGTRYAEAPALLTELHSATRAAVETEAAEVEAIARSYGAREIASAHRAADRAALWRARHQLFFAVKALYPNRRYLITDTAVPLSGVPEMVRVTEREAAALELDVVIAGHVADGNVHTIVPVAPAQEEAAREFSDRLVEHALAAGGTATGEHGIGMTKKKYLRREHGDAVDVMAAIKAALDPYGLLNPGKILDLPSAGPDGRAAAGV
jgi:D-lactate dehydrogenase (cytochrome)